MKIEFEFDDSLVGDAIPLDGVAVLSVLDDGIERYITGFMGDVSDVKVFGLFAFGYEATKDDLLNGVERSDE